MRDPSHADEGATVDPIDHIVLNCRDLQETVAWYERVLGFQGEEFGPERRTALKHWQTAAADAPGSPDICCIAQGPLDNVIARLRGCGVTFRGHCRRSARLAQ
jgi:catechol 2,3-dioxygenase-like lactoylglutathione lyase family enzyme